MQRLYLISHGQDIKRLAAYLTADPDKFMQTLSMQPDYLSHKVAKQLDVIDPLRYTAKQFNTGELKPFAGHSLGPFFLPIIDEVNKLADLQKELHKGHFKDGHPEGGVSGHWFDRDMYLPALRAIEQLIGKFNEEKEFIFTSSGLTQNLVRLLDTFYRPGFDDWKSDKTKIVMLATEFTSDQAAIASVIRRAIRTAQQFNVFNEKKVPTPQDSMLKIMPDKKGLYDEDEIIRVINKNADQIQVISLSDIIFSTGQRLDMEKIQLGIKDVRDKHGIRLILDLAHSSGNRPINLKELNVTAAVMLAYKHMSGPAGSSCGMFVNENMDLNEYPPTQGWKATNDAKKLFETINTYTPELMETSGAVAFRTSNPAVFSMLPAQTFLKYFGKIGFDKVFNKSECLTRYMVAQLRKHLGDHLEFVTPLDARHRGATIVFRLRGNPDIKAIEETLKHKDNSGPAFEIDVRPPHNIRLTPHYGYTKFADIEKMAKKLKSVVKKQLECEQRNDKRSRVTM